MAVKSMIKSCNSEKSKIFVHIKELPWMATQKDIRDFFHGLSVKDGGILIRHYDAFVAFEDPNDIDVVLSCENCLLLGSEVQLSIIRKSDLRRILFRIARRKLDFNQKDGGLRKARNKGTVVSRQKKIRPTPVIKSEKRKFESSLIFCPKESHLPPPEQYKDSIYRPCTFDNGFSPCKKRKIHPLRLPDNLYSEKFSVFHPEICYEFKNVLLDVS